MLKVSPFVNGYCQRAAFTTHRQWSINEDLHGYLLERIRNLNRYFKDLPRSEAEENLSLKIKQRYLSNEGYNYRASLPYRLNFKSPNITQENSGAGFFSWRDMEFYMRNGFVGPVKIKSVSGQRLAEVHQRFTGMLKGTTPDQNRLKILRQEWRDVDVLDLVTNPEIVAKVSSLLGKNIKMRFTSMHEVPPGLGSFSDMTNGHIPDFYAHSDMNLGTAVIPRNDTEKPFCDRDAVSVWISISGTNADNAPLFVFPGTQKWEITTPLTYLEHTKDKPEALDETCKLLSTKGFANQLNANHKLYYDFLTSSHYRTLLPHARRMELYMEPGECLFFTTHLLHGSGINLTRVSRLGMSIRYSSAMNPENEENLTVIRELFSEEERARLGLKEGDDRIPIIQVLGSEHHPRSVPVNVIELRKILTKKGEK